MLKVEKRTTAEEQWDEVGRSYIEIKLGGQDERPKGQEKDSPAQGDSATTQKE
jgi:hypothetical protein